MLKFPHSNTAKLNFSAPNLYTRASETEINDFGKNVADVVRPHIIGRIFA
jgi:hypothetical protein